MSMIENQISRLNEIREELDCDIINWRQDWAKEIKDAISTIQDLSAKLAAANMERSSAYYNGGWIPVKWRETMPEDEIDMADYPIIMDCHMPGDEEEILITTKEGLVEKDICFIDDGFCYLDSGYDWITDATAWMPLPEPYQPEEKELNRIEDMIRSHIDDDEWIPCEERLPQEKENPITRDFYEYQVTFECCGMRDVRHYKFGKGHWWNGAGIMDRYVTAWRERPEPYQEKDETGREDWKWNG